MCVGTGGAISMEQSVGSEWIHSTKMSQHAGLKQSKEYDKDRL